MKKAVIVVGMASGVLSAAAHADNSVTLYGLLDTGINYVSNSGGSKLFQMQDGVLTGLAGSRWGLKGSEDLGSGLSVIFKLENGFNVPNGNLGQGGRLFGRQAYVGLSDNHYGTLTLGRQYDTIVDYVQPITFGGQYGGLFYHANDVDNTQNSFRVNNSVKYVSPVFSGLQFEGMYAFTNSNAPGTGTTGMWSAGASYQHAGLSLAAAYFFAKHPAQLFTDGDFVSNTTGSAIGASGVWSYIGTPSNEQIVGVGGSYAIGKFTLGLDYSQAKFDDANGTTSSVKFDTYEAWLNYALSSAMTIGAGYNFSDGKVGYSGASPKYHQFGLGTTYAVSKRTTFYATAVVQKAAGDATVADIADGVVGNASSTNKQFAARVGIMHKF